METELLPASYGSCRFCQSELRYTFVDLGMSPLCESYLSHAQLNEMEPFYPLHVFVCEKCLLVQLLDYVSAESIYSEYAYFSSYSDSWLKHARNYVDTVTDRFGLSGKELVVELASNDGYLLQYFKEKGIPVLGIEPAANVAKKAEKKGITTVVKFFGQSTASEVVAQSKQANLIVGNNVLAHVPDINDFVAGMKILLAPEGVITMEFPHLWRLMEGNQFDTIYHEHFSYLSLLTTNQIFASHGLQIFDVEELPSHGGSLRIYAQHSDGKQHSVTDNVTALVNKEKDLKFDQLVGYSGFGEQVEQVKRNLLKFLIQAKEEGKSVAGYGAPGKGNTLLNYCGIRTDFIDYSVDRNPYKHGKYLPGTHIPIHPPERIQETKPDYILIMPWNLRKEISSQLKYCREWGARFVVAIPELEVF